ncbi:hypothetical protein N2152v2_003242 [Parachlorella kessleri]
MERQDTASSALPDNEEFSRLDPYSLAAVGLPAHGLSSQGSASSSLAADAAASGPCQGGGSGSGGSRSRASKGNLLGKLGGFVRLGLKAFNSATQSTIQSVGHSLGGEDGSNAAGAHIDGCGEGKQPSTQSGARGGFFDSVGSEPGGAAHAGSHPGSSGTDAGSSRDARDSGGSARHSSGSEGLGLGHAHSAGSELATTDITKLPEAWNIVGFQELELGRVIGEGSFGQVWLAKYCQTPVAVKMLTPQRMANASDSMQARSTLRQLSKEAGIMSSLRHPNITLYLGVCPEPPCLLMEYCSRKSVDSILRAAQDEPKAARHLTWARLLSMAHDAAKGMLYLHSRHIIHRDLKSANLLVDAHWHVKVSDFNLSKAMEAASANSTICITNPRWLAPEVLVGGHAQLESDVWAFGTVMWELMTWHLPFEKLNPFQVIMMVNSSKEGAGLVIPPPDNLPAGRFSGYDEYVDIMMSCWARNPSDRPAMGAIAARLATLLSKEMRRPSLTSAGSLPEGALPATPSGSSETPAAAAAAAAGGRGGGSGLRVVRLPSTPAAALPMVSPVLAGAAGGGGGVAGVSSFAAAAGGLWQEGDETEAAARPAMPVTAERAMSATDALLAAGHVTVAHAADSQKDSGRSSE